MQAGRPGFSCPNETAEEYHVNDGRHAVIARTRTRSDGLPVDAFLWTSLYPTARSVLLNVENDDYGRVIRDTEPCSCLYGRLGSRTRVADVRGMSKVVAGELECREMGRLAAGFWNPTGAIRVERDEPRVARSGKTLAFEPLGPTPTR